MDEGVQSNIKAIIISQLEKDVTEGREGF